MCCPRCAFLATQKSTRGGSSESDVNAFAVIPRPVPSISAAITVTPVTNCPTVRRNSRGSISIDLDQRLLHDLADVGVRDEVRHLPPVDVVLLHALLREAHVALARAGDVGDD